MSRTHGFIRGFPCGRGAMKNGKTTVHGLECYNTARQGFTLCGRMLPLKQLRVDHMNRLIICPLCLIQNLKLSLEVIDE